MISNTETPYPKVAILGIGNELRGDDGAGLMVARKLKERNGVQEDCLILETGSVPENYTSSLRRFKPDLVMLIDAARMGLSPGTVRWLDPYQTTGYSASTHSLPLHVFSVYITEELGCSVKLLAVQPAGTEFDSDLSFEVAIGVEQATNEVLRAIQHTRFRST